MPPSKGHIQPSQCYKTLSAQRDTVLHSSPCGVLRSIVPVTRLPDSFQLHQINDRLSNATEALGGRLDVGYSNSKHVGARAGVLCGVEREVEPPPGPRKYWTRRGIAGSLVERLSEDRRRASVSTTVFHSRCNTLNSTDCRSTGHLSLMFSSAIGRP